MKAIKNSIIAGVSAAVLLTPVIAPAHAEDLANDSTLVVTVTNDEPLHDAIVRDALINPEYREDALDMVDAWQERARDGQTVPDVTGDGSATELDPQILDQLETDLLDASTEAATTPQDVGINATPTGLDPNEFSIEGWAPSDKTYWTDLILSHTRKTCSSSGDCIPTDRAVCNFTISIGAVITRVNWSCTYTHTTNAFKDMQFEFWAMTRGQVISLEPAVDTLFDVNLDSPSKTKVSVSTDEPMNSRYLAFAVAFSAEHNIYGIPMMLHAVGKTTDALCMTRGDNRCRFE